MTIAIIGSVLIGLLIGGIFGACANSSPYPFSLEDFERERRIRAESETMKFYIQMENMRQDNIRLRSYPVYRMPDSLNLEIGKLPRAQSTKEAEEKYGEHWKVTDAIIGKVNEVISEVNDQTIKKIRL